MSDNKDYEKYLHQDEKSWGEFFSNLSKYWHGVMEECSEDMDCVLDDDEYHNAIAELNECPETACYASDMKKARLIAKASDKAMKTIGKCIDGAAVLFGKKQ